MFEKSNQLGGNVITGSQAPFKHDDAQLITWFEGEMSRKGVDVRMNTAADLDVINAENPDSVIFATGSRPSVPAWLKGAEKEHVAIAEDVLMQPEQITGNTVTVIGAGLVGAETALWLAQKGKTVTLIEAADDIIGGPHGTCFANYQMLKELLVKENVDVRTSTFLNKVTDSGVEVREGETNSNIEAEHVILAMGYKAESGLFDNVANQVNAGEVFNVGDSQQARTIMAAIWEGYEVARAL
jgi:2-enoate reductase